MDSRLKKILEENPRYARESYPFVFEALQYTQNKLGKSRHVSGQELLKGIRELAIINFGGLARMVFREWGIEKTEDFGRIVFTLVDHGLMGKTEEDDLSDFSDGYDFDDAFPLDAVPPGDPEQENE